MHRCHALSSQVSKRVHWCVASVDLQVSDACGTSVLVRVFRRTPHSIGCMGQLVYRFAGSGSVLCAAAGASLAAASAQGFIDEVAASPGGAGKGLWRRRDVGLGAVAADDGCAPCTLRSGIMRAGRRGKFEVTRSSCRSNAQHVAVWVPSRARVYLAASHTLC